MENINLLYKKFKFIRQLESADCGPTCLSMIANYYGKKVNIHQLRTWCHINKSGVSFSELIDAATYIGFTAVAVKITMGQLVDKAPKPCILHWKDNHYVVFLGLDKQGRALIADPGFSKLKIKQSDFFEYWKRDDDKKGIALLLIPNETFTIQEIKANDDFNKRLFFLNYLKPFKTTFIGLLLLLLIITGISVFYPFINERLVDEGIHMKNMQVVLYLLLAQFVLYTSTTAIEFIQGWLFLHVNTKLNISLITDFLKKLIRMPLMYFESKLTTDILLRIDDHKRIEEFFSNHSLQFLVSLLLFGIYSILLIHYSLMVFLFFILSSALSVLWVYSFQNSRRHINYRRFEIETKNKNILYEIINGISDLKINNATDYKTKQWKEIELDLFKLNKSTILLELKQSIGVKYVSQLKNISIIAYVSYLVIHHHLSLGALLSISFIIGQLTLPIENFIAYLYSYQDASISLDRLSDVYRQKDESQLYAIHKEKNKHNLYRVNNAIRFNQVKYSYFGGNSFNLFEDLNLSFPLNKVSAIVGTSGSGKTTVIKLLLKYCHIQSGTITFKGQDINQIESDVWRDLISVVFQDGYIFSDTVQENITLGAPFDPTHFKKVTHLSNCSEFIANLPQKEQTRIGENGIGLSKGQFQRILIARAMYKNPKILILDEATSALDAENEKIIHDNLVTFFKDRTVIIIAHRLSTVKHADQIIVLSKGKVVETGTHKELIQNHRFYYSLIKNQLEI
ncbi:peptidase domain-containing ABC transporter [Myroides sp. NP-2]|uniref:peptidase domain-containing ABC transporter n=1 Tax=Myroides sp. NP-2 TaxID=2759945 RepID=UPI0015F9AA59|nr:peptidase domain-containing ABC transporter [Myroides sp. NP-2]MBB1150847.1 peptidase domain-containing ABC transporter [Myroides sp. NP-2]